MRGRIKRLPPEVLILACLLGCYGYFFPRWADWNQNSRLDLTLAIVEQGRFEIDDYYQNTGDYAVYGGHIYTDKAPGTSFLGVPIYAIYRAVARLPVVDRLITRLSGSEALRATLREEGTGLLQEKVYQAGALYALVLSTVALPSALLGVMLFRFLGRLGLSTGLRGGLVLAYGLATIAFPYSTVFYGHQIAAVLLFATFALVYRVRSGELGARWLWLVGALIGLTVITEYPALVATGLLVVYLLWGLAARESRSAARLARLWGGICRVALGGLPFALLLGYYNNACFGSPIASSYRYLGRFPEISNTGFLGFSAPSWEAFWGITFSLYRGLFPMSPFLLLAVPGTWLALPGLARGERRAAEAVTTNESAANENGTKKSVKGGAVEGRSSTWARVGRAEGVLLGGTVAAHLFLISCWYDWRGGFAIGPRNLLLVLPYMAVLVGFCLRGWPGTRWGFWVLSLAAFVAVWIASTAGQEFSPIDVRIPLTQFWWPRFAEGDIARNLGMALGLEGWWSLVPPLLVIAGTSWVLLRRTIER